MSEREDYSLALRQGAREARADLLAIVPAALQVPLEKVLNNIHFDPEQATLASSYMQFIASEQGLDAGLVQRLYQLMYAGASYYLLLDAVMDRHGRRDARDGDYAPVLMDLILCRYLQRSSELFGLQAVQGILLAGRQIAEIFVAERDPGTCSLEQLVQQHAIANKSASLIAFIDQLCHHIGLSEAQHRYYRGNLYWLCALTQLQDDLDDWLDDYRDGTYTPFVKFILSRYPAQELDALRGEGEAGQRFLAESGLLGVGWAVLLEWSARLDPDIYRGAYIGEFTRRSRNAFQQKVEKMQRVLQGGSDGG
jgi:hypothetical protein